MQVSVVINAESIRLEISAQKDRLTNQEKCHEVTNILCISIMLGKRKRLSGGIMRTFVVLKIILLGR